MMSDSIDFAATEFPSALRRFILRYAALEQRVGALMSQVCGLWCGCCQDSCCRCDMCEESLDSAFLRAVIGLTPPDAPFSDHVGWLTLHGCALKAGRPPVCYEFVCDEIMHELSGDTIRYAVRSLGKSLYYVGEEAWQGLHLVEIVLDEQLRQVDCIRLQRRLEEAEEAVQDIECMLVTHTQSKPTAAMMKICPSDTELYQGA